MRERLPPGPGDSVQPHTAGEPKPERPPRRGRRRAATPEGAGIVPEQLPGAEPQPRRRRRMTQVEYDAWCRETGILTDEEYEKLWGDPPEFSPPYQPYPPGVLDELRAQC